MAKQRHQPADTKERILSAAESLFMERGYAATSLRKITAKAKVNLAAVNYHFGSKDTLIREVFERRVGPLNSARIAHLDRLESDADGRPLTAEQIMEAIVAPALQVSKDPLGGDAVFLRLLGQAFSEPARSISEILPAQYRQVVVRFKEALLRALPHLPDQELTWRMHFMFGALSYAMAGNDALKLIATCNLEGADQPDSIIRRLVPFLAAGLQAPPVQAQPKRSNPPRRIGSISGRRAA
ncbi:MAG TPA: TetR family transcriptional regulator [Burkholderiales bacterium]|nr:TetR family transcriptional regulator [Burkholderiales bacterium]